MGEESQSRPSPWAVALLEAVLDALASVRKRVTDLPGPDLLACVLYAGGHRPLFRWARLADRLEEIVPSNSTFYLDAARKAVSLSTNAGDAAAPAIAAADGLELALDAVRYHSPETRSLSPYIEGLVHALLQSRLPASGESPDAAGCAWVRQGLPCLASTHSAVVALARCLRDSGGSESQYKLPGDVGEQIGGCLSEASHYLESRLIALASGGGLTRRPSDALRVALCTHALTEIHLLDVTRFPFSATGAQHGAMLLLEIALSRPHLLGGSVFLRPEEEGASPATAFEEKAALSRTLRALAETHRLFGRHEAAADEAGWLIGLSFARERTRSAMTYLSRLITDLRDPTDCTWEEGRFDARATLLAIIALVESAEAIWEAARDCPARPREHEGIYEWYEGVRWVLSNESAAHTIATVIARELAGGARGEGGSG